MKGREFNQIVPPFLDARTFQPGSGSSPTSPAASMLEGNFQLTTRCLLRPPVKSRMRSQEPKNPNWTYGPLTCNDSSQRLGSEVNADARQTSAHLQSLHEWWLRIAKRGVP